MDQVECKFLKPQKFKPFVWFRYISFIWAQGEKIVKNFVIECNNLNPNIKFTQKFSDASINFLNLNVKLFNGKLQTSFYLKSTDHHLYLHFQLSDPKHTKRSIVYSQTLRSQ